jgi:23S rRNA (pseudouridine1915-N3)-methyltransferase
VRVHLLAFGKLRVPGLRESAEYYLRNLKPWCALEEIELKPVPVPDKSPATRARVQEKETELLLERVRSQISERARIYLLDELGKPLPTREWASRVREWEASGSADIVLCLGSSVGWSDTLRKKAAGTFSLGPQTLSHELARVVLLEQLYRAWSVVRGHPYHNEG